MRDHPAMRGLVVWLLCIAVSSACSSDHWPAPRPESISAASPAPVEALSDPVVALAPPAIDAPVAEPPTPAPIETTGREPIAAREAEPLPAREPEVAAQEPEAVAREPEAAAHEPEPLAAPEPEPEPEEPAAPLPPPSAPVELFAVGREVFVLAAPNPKAKKLGYLRAGGRVLRSENPVSFEGCAGGFYRVAPEGFVCAGEGARLTPGPAHELLGASVDRFAPLPFVYARVVGTPPFYTKLPNDAEQAQVEPEVSRARQAKQFADLTAQALPAWLADGKTTPTPFGHRREASSVFAGRALPNSSFAVLGVLDRGPRRFAVVNDLTLVPLDRAERVTGSDFHGLSLDEQSLPVAFVMRRGVEAFTGDAKSGLRPGRKLGYREAVPIRSGRVNIGGLRFVETVSGELVRDDRLVIVEPLAELPRWAKAGRRWIRVSITNQSLVAYEGDRPVYVTLVSTGKDGLGDPATSRSTVRGQFLIHTKHVTAAMSSAEAGDEYDLRDVPWVQYFSDNYAFHAAYWHDAFGTARSHGCINLAPRDARFLFHWTDPPVPQGWHGAFSLLGGTLVDIVP